MNAVLQVRDLRVSFGATPAVRGVDFSLRRGEVLGIVGESGSGKSVTALALLGLLPDGAEAGGSVRLDGTELLGAGEGLLNTVRGNRIGMVFQDPLSAFTPVYRIGAQIAEAVRAHQDVSRQQADRRAVELLDLVGIPEPQVRAAAFPHEFSGGMRQRAMIAMAMANDPDVILADEPTTALDVTIQAQVLHALRTAQRATGAAMVLISHDLGVIAGSADRVAVMYAGRIVETAPVDELFARPRMPYTLGLLGAVPRLDGAATAVREVTAGAPAGAAGGSGAAPPSGAGDAAGRPDDAGLGAGSPDVGSVDAGSMGAGGSDGVAPHRAVLVPIPGAPPAADALPAGCTFAPRCPLAEPACRAAEPELLPVGAHAEGGGTGFDVGAGAGAGAATVNGVVQRKAPTGTTAPSRAPAAQGGPAPAPHAHPTPGAPVAPEALEKPPESPGPPEAPDAPPPAPAAVHLTACLRAGEILRRRLGPADVFPVPPLADRPAALDAPEDASPVLRVRALKKTFPLFKGSVFKRRTGSVYAVDGVDLDIARGETLGLVGESGSGKSTTLFEILGLRRPEAGTVEVLGRSTADLTARQVRRLRSQLQIVFQDPMASLDPRMPVADIIAEPLRALGADRAAVRRRIPELLGLVGLEEAHAMRFPHEFSGGQRQRIGIARALAVDPRLLVLDEPVSALDVSIQAGVLNLLQQLRAELGLAYLFVSHDLSVVRHIADRVSVMYMGRTVEAGAVREVFAHPRHPYTQALLSAVPLPDPPRERRRERILLAGDPPSPTQRDTGCRFRGRCPVFAALDAGERERCAGERPALLGRGGDHVAACHFPRERAVL